MTKKLLSYIKANPGQRSEQIAAGLGVETSEMVVPIKRLLAEKAIRSAGLARGTTYTTVP